MFVCFDRLSTNGIKITNVIEIISSVRIELVEMSERIIKLIHVRVIGVILALLSDMDHIAIN
jgi:hypothetical protein